MSQLAKPLGYLGLVFGAAGALSFLAPPLTLLGAVLGIIWSVWLGLVLVREPVAGNATVPTEK